MEDLTLQESYDILSINPFFFSRRYDEEKRLEAAREYQATYRRACQENSQKKLAVAKNN